MALAESGKMSGESGSSDCSPTLSPKTPTKNDGIQEADRYPPLSSYQNLKVISVNDQIRELQTILRDQ